MYRGYTLQKTGVYLYTKHSRPKIAKDLGISVSTVARAQKKYYRMLFELARKRNIEIEVFVNDKLVFDRNDYEKLTKKM